MQAPRKDFAMTNMNASNQIQPRHTPFYCGTQRMDWKCYNCDFCTKRYDEAKGAWRCDLEGLIDVAYMGDGTFDAATAKRMGEPDDCRVYNWRCPEFIEDANERARVAELVRTREAARRAYENRNRPAPWIEAWLAGRTNAKTRPHDSCAVTSPSPQCRNMPPVPP